MNKSSISWACNSARVKWKDKLEEKRETLKAVKQDIEIGCRDWNMNPETAGVLTGLVEEKLKKMDKELGTEGEEVINTKSLDELQRAFTRNFWKDQPKLSLLIATDLEARSDLQNARPDTSSRNQAANQDVEYYAYLTEEDTKALFGRAFATLLTII